MRTMNHIKAVIIAFLLLPFFAFSQQKSWTLQDCITHAMQNNIVIQQTNLTQELAENNLKLAKWDLYSPNVNSSVGYNFNFGNSLDPTTFDFVRANSKSSSLGLNTSYNLFEGLRRINTLKKNELDVSATEFEIEEIKRNTQLSIAETYLQALLANEMKQSTQAQLNHTLKQLQQTQELVNAGVLPNGDMAEINAQKANDEFNVISAQNALDVALANLKVLLQLDPYQDFSIVQPGFNPDDLTLDAPQTTTSNSLSFNTGIKGAELRLQSSERDLKIAKGSLSPTLSVTTNYGTNYFSGAIDFQTGEKIPGGQQLKENFSEGVGFNLGIPILSKGQRLIAIDNAEIGILNAQFDVETKKNDVKQKVFTAYTEAQAAQKKYESAKVNYEASKQAFDYAGDKQKAGMINNFEFQTVKNRLLTSEIELSRAKYEFLFRKMMLDFYEGKELKF